jgi:hypothetical protein
LTGGSSLRRHPPRSGRNIADTVTFVDGSDSCALLDVAYATPIDTSTRITESSAIHRGFLIGQWFG